MQSKREEFERRLDQALENALDTSLEIKGFNARDFSEARRMVLEAFDDLVDPVLRNSYVGEPVFVLRGQDQSAVPTVQFWLDENAEAPAEKFRSAAQRAIELEAWNLRKEAD